MGNEAAISPPFSSRCQGASPYFVLSLLRYMFPVILRLIFFLGGGRGRDSAGGHEASRKADVSVSLIALFPSNVLNYSTQSLLVNEGATPAHETIFSLSRLRWRKVLVYLQYSCRTDAVSGRWKATNLSSLCILLLCVRGRNLFSSV